MAYENVDNHFVTPNSGSDNELKIGGSMDIESTSTFKVEGTQVVTAGLADKLNNLESGTAVTGIAALAGGGQTGATALTGEYNDVTTVASAFDSVKLPTAVSGLKVKVKNSGASILSVFPFLADSINALAVNLSVDIPVGGEVIFNAISATVWETIETLYVSSPTTQTGGIAIKATASAGNTDTTITNASQAAARTYTIPDGGANASFLLTKGAQTVDGVQTYTAPQVIDTNTTITAFATGGQGSATALTGEYNEVTTCASAYDSVKLLAAVAGQVQTVKNSGAAILSVFPNTDDTINALAANLSIDIPVGGEMTFRATGVTAWETIEAINLSAPTTQTGNLVIKASDNAANHEVSITNASHGQATAISIPDGGQATANFLLSEGNQTIAGVQTYSLPNVYDVNTTITAFAGGGQGSATALTGEYNNVTTVASAYDSVALPTAVLGQKITVKNSGAAILSVFPAASDSINALAINLSVDIPVSGEVVFTAISDTVWETVETLYVSSPTTQTGGLAIKATASAGNFDTTITNASQAAARTYTIPDAGASAEFVMNQDLTDYVKFMGLQDVLAYSAGTWTVTRVAQGDYVNRKTAADDTTIVGIDITESLRTTASKGLKLTSFDVIFRNITADLDAHSVTLDKMAYTNSAVVSTTSVALTGALATGQDNDPQISNVTLDTPAFNVTDDSKYVMELTVDAAAGSVYDFIGVMLKFTRNDK
jgi:hypothetical protein